MSSPDPREDLFEELRAGLKGVMVAMRRMRGRETHLRGQKLSFAQFGLLHELDSEACLSARDLAQRADLSPGSVTQMLDALEAIGLVERTRSTEDKRVVLTKLTDQGHEMLDTRKEQIEARWHQLLTKFTDAELRAASEVLKSVSTYFNELD